MIIEFKDKTFARITDEQYAKIKGLLTSPNAPRFFDLNGELFETYKIRSIVSDTTGESYIRQADNDAQRSGGGWRCHWGNWHSRQHTDCSCFDPRWRDHNRGKHAQTIVLDARPQLEAGKPREKHRIPKIPNVSDFTRTFASDVVKSMPGQKQAIAERDNQPMKNCKACDVMIAKGSYCQSCKPAYADL